MSPGILTSWKIVVSYTVNRKEIIKHLKLYIFLELKSHECTYWKSPPTAYYNEWRKPHQSTTFCNLKILKTKPQSSR